MRRPLTAPRIAPKMTQPTSGEGQEGKGTMRVDHSDLIASEDELAALCVKRGIGISPLAAIRAPGGAGEGESRTIEVPSDVLTEDVSWALGALADPARCLDLHTALGEEILRRVVLAWGHDGHPRIAVLEDDGEERRVGQRSTAHVRAAIVRALPANPTPVTIRRALSASAAVVLVAVADHLRRARLTSLLDMARPDKRFTAADVRARLAQSGRDDFRWALNFLDKLWPSPLASHALARDVEGALAELDAAGLIARGNGGAGEAYEAVGQGEILAAALGRDDVKVGLAVRRPPVAAGAGEEDVALLVGSRHYVALLHMVRAEAAVRLVDSAELEDWLARVIVFSPQSATAPLARGDVAATVSIGSVQTLVMTLSPTVLRIELSDPSEKARAVTLVGEATLGRQAGNKIIVSEPGVSRIHARIYRDDRGLWMVNDLDTANGTFVNERRIDRPTPIRPGDVIRVSATQLRVLAEG